MIPPSLPRWSLQKWSGQMREAAPTSSAGLSTVGSSHMGFRGMTPKHWWRTAAYVWGGHNLSPLRYGSGFSAGACATPAAAYRSSARRLGPLLHRSEQGSVIITHCWLMKTGQKLSVSISPCWKGPQLNLSCQLMGKYWAITHVYFAIPDGRT